MKKTMITTAAAIAAVAALGGCGTKTVVVEVPASTTAAIAEEAPDTTAAPVELSAREKENRFVQEIARNYPSFVQMTGAKWLVDFGYMVCDEIGNGLTVRGLATLVVEAGVGELAGEVGYVAGAAIRSFCPENQWWIDSATNS